MKFILMPYRVVLKQFGCLCKIATNSNRLPPFGRYVYPMVASCSKYRKQVSDVMIGSIFPSFKWLDVVGSCFLAFENRTTEQNIQ